MTLLVAAALLGLVSVAFGAFTEHGLREQVSEEMLRYLMTAIRYNQVHAVAGLAVGLASLSRIDAHKPLLTVSGWGFVIGTALFSGSIYFAALFDQLAFTMLTPIGGTTLILSWLGLVATGVVATLNERRRRGSATAAAANSNG